MNRIDRRKREINDRILQSAFDLFLVQGVAATTIEEICQRADVANRTFLNHFPTRQAMLAALAQRQLTDMHDLEHTRVDEPVPARIIGMFDDIAGALLKSRDTYREVINEMMAAVGHGTHRGSGLDEMFVEMLNGGVARATSPHAMTRRPWPTSSSLRCRVRSATGLLTRPILSSPVCTTPLAPWPSC